MAYEIVFIEEEAAVAPGRPAERAVGEQVFLANLPTTAKVFAFYYPGDADMEEVENRLRNLGRRSGDNLFVNIGSLVDPDYRRAVQRFGIGPLPVIIVTAVSPLAATSTGKTVFVRLDNTALFADPERLIRTVEELFNLFLGGRIAKALVLRATSEGASYAGAVARRVWAVIQPVISWITSRDLTIALLGAKIEMKAKGQ